MIAAQQLGVTLGDTPTSEQAKSDHQYFPVSRDVFARPWRRRRSAARQIASDLY
jgi:hypothetical protein